MKDNHMIFNLMFFVLDQSIKIETLCLFFFKKMQFPLEKTQESPCVVVVSFANFMDKKSETSFYGKMNLIDRMDGYKNSVKIIGLAPELQDKLVYYSDLCTLYCPNAKVTRSELIIPKNTMVEIRKMDGKFIFQGDQEDLKQILIFSKGMWRKESADKIISLSQDMNDSSPPISWWGRFSRRFSRRENL
jgi:hypothetical protein